MKRFWLLWVAPPVLLFAAFLAPAIAGSETFFLRDVMSVHAGLRAGLDAADGAMPLVDPLRGGGQPAAGNPNVVALHPSALLHRVLPFFAAFGAHLWLHLLAAPFALFWLARELGLGRRGAWAAAVVWGFSGFVLSQAAFFNVVAAVATAPALAAAAVGAARRLAEGRAAGRHLAATGTKRKRRTFNGKCPFRALGIQRPLLGTDEFGLRQRQKMANSSSYIAWMPKPGRRCITTCCSRIQLQNHLAIR